jgi:hypothetical protein
MKKRLVIFGILLSFMLVCTTLVGCSLLEAKEKTFTKAGMSITLTQGFTEEEYVSYTAYYQSQKVIVTVMKEEFSLFESAGLYNLSLNEYADMVVAANSFSTTVKEKDGLLCFEYQEHVGGKDTSNFAIVYKGSDAFWTVRFACETKNYNNLLDSFVKWGKTVKV